MKITLKRKTYEFVPWKAEMGQVFRRPFAFDCETTLIDEERPWLVPAYVIGAACDGREGYFVRREHVGDFFRAHAEQPIVMHNAPFDLAVINVLAAELDIYGRVDAHHVWDTQLLHRLWALATDGHTASGKGQSTLERCVEHHLGLALPKDVVDSRGALVRLSYGQWLGRDPREIGAVYLEYLGKDVVVTFLLFQRLRKQLNLHLRASQRAWGFVSGPWLEAQMRRWGPQTHHLQLKAAIVLQAITANGLPLDLDHRDQLRAQLRQVAEEHREILHRSGYIPAQNGSSKALRAIIERLARRHRGRECPRTPTGLIATSEDALAALAEIEPFVRALFAYRAVEKLESAFLDKMGKPVLHPSFDVLKVTGRTSSFGALNAQNLPKDDRVRELFVPPAGQVWIDADYVAIEMGTLAQALLSQFGLRSQLAETLNAGKDPHRMVAALATGKREAEVTKDERQKCKPINFGKPGGMGHDSLKGYAQASYGVALTDTEVETLSNAWFTLFPEMRAFLGNDQDLGADVAAFFGLTPASHAEHTGSRKFVAHPANAGREHRPHVALGGMCLKVLKERAPETGAGRAYADAELDYFWSRVATRLVALPGKHQDAVRQRRPSAELQRAVMGLVGRGPVFTLTGRLRANATYSARHNNIFQGLASDGAKLALWLLWRAGYVICNFIHDEVLIAVPDGPDLDEHARRIRAHMIAGMRAVLPDVRVEVEYVASTVWSKAAEKVTDDAGRLLAWSPPGAEIRNSTTPKNGAAESDGATMTSSSGET